MRSLGRMARGAVLLWLLAAAGPLAAANAAKAPPTAAVDRYYAQAAAPLLWLRDGRLSPAGRALLGELAGAAARGLRPEDYNASALARDAAALAPAPVAGAAATALDRALSQSAAHLVSDLQRGRVRPEDVGYALGFSRAPLDVLAALRALSTSSTMAATLDGYEPSYRHYALLKQALAQYRALAALPALPPLPALKVRSVKPGEAYAGAGALRALLERLGDLPPAGAPPLAVLDKDLVAGLARFQSRHGLGADGVLGPSTWRALAVPLPTRVRQIELSMERARWLPPPPDGPFILVNIPAFRLFAFRGPGDSEQAMTAMNVIVGQTFPQKNTPVFMADLRYVVWRPYWDVPASIMRKEVLPRLRKDLAWGTKEGFELVRGQSDNSPVVPLSAAALDELQRGALRLRQRSGQDNALGLVKFMLPNRFNVYLHSTPAQRLFGQTQRTFSHGCVRVADPVGLGRFLLAEDPSWTAERIQSEMNAEGPPGRVYLKHPIPVVLYYATALAAEDGRVLFYNDIYRHDLRLESLLSR